MNVPFGSPAQNSDPNVSYFDTYQVSLQTLQIDSFITSGKQVFTLGYHNDPICGTIHAGSYAQLNLPAINTLLNQNVSFDSLQIILKPQGSYYGDTTKTIHLKVYQLTQLIQNGISNSNPTAGDIYYNSASFEFNPVALGERTTIVYPKRGDSITVRISDALGQDLLNKFQTGATQVSTQDLFTNYFNGIYIDVDSTSTNTLYNFSSFTNSVVMRLYYKLNGNTSIQQHLDFTYNTAKQFNHVNYNHTGTPLAAFTPFQENQLISSTQTGNKAFLSSSTGYFIKIGFPDIINLKALYPYVKVVSAQLIIPPSSGTYNYPYILPPTLYLFQTDIYNDVSNPVVGVDGSLQNGNLFIDNMYGQSTQYTYDVTNFITTLLAQGSNPNGLSLLLAPSNALGDQSLSRLIINDQNSIKGIRLKLYVLGL
ncbi:MAG: DUF4270 family protein [Ferruginibacter sp.]